MKRGFEQFLKDSELHEEFCTEMRADKRTPYNNLAELFKKADVDEYVAEAFDWSNRQHWKNLDFEWRVKCGTK